MSKKTPPSRCQSNGHTSRFDLDGLLNGGTPKQPQRKVRAKTTNQGLYMEAIENNRIVFCLGPAGTGKTHIAAGMAAREYQAGNIKRIIGVRPTVELGNNRLGFLPGTLDEKLHPYLRPLLTELAEFFPPAELKRLRDGDIPIIELDALQYIRGNTFKDSIVIMDEAQNCTKKELEAFLTRLGYGTRMIINGDTSRDADGNMRQCDLFPGDQGAVEEMAAKTRGFKDQVEVITMTKADCVRDPFLRELLEII